jgi:hypothetical protein
MTIGPCAIRLRLALLALAAVLAGGAVAAPAAARPADAPTDCTEVMASATTFIGHNCGEWASVMIVGRIVIRKPWSRANRATRAVRLRERREGGAVASEPPATAAADGAAADRTGCHPDYVQCLPIGQDVNCPDPIIAGFGGTVELFDPRNDAYELDDKSGVGNGIGCDDQS